MTVRDVVFPPGPRALNEKHRYSPAVRSGDLLFVSGQVGSRDDGSPEPELAAQVRRVFQKLNAVLEAAHCSFADVVDVTIFIVDPETRFEQAWEIAREFWGEAPYPNATVVGATWLAGFVFEIKVVARIPAGEGQA